MSAMEEARDLADAAADHFAEQENKARRALFDSERDDFVPRDVLRDQYLADLWERHNAARDELAYLAREITRVKNWCEDEPAPRADRDLPGMDARVFGRHEADNPAAEPVVPRGTAA